MRLAKSGFPLVVWLDGQGDHSIAPIISRQASLTGIVGMNCAFSGASGLFGQNFDPASLASLLPVRTYHAATQIGDRHEGIRAV
jgi:hypothetical protein